MLADPFAPLETARMHLRCVAAGDTAATAALMTPAVSRWVAAWPVPFSSKMAAARIATMRELAFKGDALPFALVAKADAALVGWAVIERDHTHRRRGALGYWLGEAHHGNGYMKEIVPAVLAAGFAVLDLDTIEAAAQPGNAGSFAVMRACGMRPTGEGMVYAPARGREELCCFYEIARPRPG